MLNQAMIRQPVADKSKEELKKKKEKNKAIYTLKLKSRKDTK